MQADPLTPSHPHAHLKPLEAVEPMHAVSADPPAFAVQQDVDALVAKARPPVGRAREYACAGPSDPSPASRSRTSIGAAAPADTNASCSLGTDRGSTVQSRVVVPASGLFFEYLLQDVPIQRQIGHQALESHVLVLQGASKRPYSSFNLCRDFGVTSSAVLRIPSIPMDSASSLASARYGIMTAPMACSRYYFDISTPREQILKVKSARCTIQKHT